jgi:branched-chain amino acid transport system ATP-binding protein
MDILQTKGLCKFFGGVHALENVDICVEQGTIHGLIGPNGSGKSTFRSVVTGLLPSTDGKVIFAGRDITGLPPHVITKLGITCTFQMPRLVPDMTCLENVMLGSHCRTKLDFLGTYLRLPLRASAQERRISERAHELLGYVGMESAADRWARDMSWVQEHLLQVARALASDPQLIILDEPTAGMGAAESMVVQSVIKRVQATGVTCILIAHDMNLVMGICDRISVLCFGHKVAEGTPDEIQNDAKVLEVYLGEE